MYFKIAWRNIWRNKRRSLITMASILFAVFFAIAMRSIQLGMYDAMIDNIVGSYTGYIQVHQKGYWEEQTLDNSFDLEDELIAKIEGTEDVKLATPRLQGFALSAYEQQTKGVMVVGIDPEKEKEFMDVDAKLKQGAMFSMDDKSIIIGQGLAEYYGVGVNDTLVLLGQGRHGMNAAGKYAVAGIAKYNAPQLNNGLTVLPLKEAQSLYSADNMGTAFALMIEGQDETDDIKAALTTKLDTSQYEVMDWGEMMPELLQSIQADSAGGIIMLLILYMVITFGIFGTVLMMTAERQHEYGVLLAVGMKRWQLSIVTLIEMAMMAALGAIGGILIAYPLTMYFKQNPIQMTGNAAEAMEKFGFEAVIPASTDPSIALTHGLIVVVISILITLYPAWVVKRMKPVVAMRG